MNYRLISSFLIIFSLILLLSNVYATGESNSTNINNTDCKQEINAYNAQIRELFSADANFITEKQTNIKQSKDEINRLLIEYKSCLWKKINKRSAITGKFTLQNDLTIANVDSDEVMIADLRAENNQINSPEINPELDLIDDHLINSDSNYLTQVNARIDAFTRDFNFSECNNILNKINEQKEIYSSNVLELNKFKEDNKDLLVKVKELVAKRNDLRNDCNLNTNKFLDCNAQTELDDKLTELETEMMQHKIKITDSNSSDYNKYSELKEKYFAIKNKQLAKKITCEIQNKYNNQNDNCKKLNMLLLDVNLIQEKLTIETTNQNTALLKTKLDYLQTKLGEVDCNSDNYLKINNSINKQHKQDNINKLNKEIYDNNKTIQQLHSKINDLQAQLRSANHEEKQEYLVNFTDELKDDSVAKINTKLSSLKLLIEQIDDSNLPDETKNKLIDLINTRIANLEVSKTNLENAETTLELASYIKKAKENDELANKDIIVTGLDKQTIELETIINKYYKNSKDYELLTTELNALKTNVSEISSLSTTEELNLVKNQYETLKNKVKEDLQRRLMKK